MEGCGLLCLPLAILAWPCPPQQLAVLTQYPAALAGTDLGFCNWTANSAFHHWNLSTPGHATAGGAALALAYCDDLKSALDLELGTEWYS